MHILLMGAGFSRNWGGWLADELTGNLLGQIEGDSELRRLLQTTHAFESVLTDLQNSRNLSTENEERCKILEDAVLSSFKYMNLSFCDPTFRFNKSSDRNMDISRFLARFDSLFTLNQDLLLELHYKPHLDSGPVQVDLPGLCANTCPIEYPIEIDLHQRLKQTFSPRPQSEFELLEGKQKIFKLHGSVDWIQQSGKGLVIIGGNKPDAIQSNPLLQRYYNEFRKALNAGNTRLMVIGYSFQDLHINDLIWTAAEKHGLTMFLVDPRGLGLIQKSMGEAELRTRWTTQDIPLIGVSQRPLFSTFSDDKLEHGKLMRFFK